MIRRLRLPSALVLLLLLLVAATCSRGGPDPGPVEPDGVPSCGPTALVLGVNDQGAADPDLVREAGLRWVRVGIPWREVNPARGEWRWDGADSAVRPHHEAGHRVLAILSTAPEWAGSNATGTRPPEEIALWSEYVARVAERYRGEIDAYEIWNEPDRSDEGIGVGWDRPAREHPTYGEYLRAAALAIREHAPGAEVVGPALGSDPEPETMALLRRLGEPTLPEGSPASFLDVVTLHANARDDEGSDDVWRRLRRHLRAVGRLPELAGKPVWITELGWPSGSVGEAGQAEKIENLLALVEGPWEGIEHPAYCGPQPPETIAFVYKLRDGGGESRGIFREDGTPKPAARSLAPQ